VDIICHYLMIICNYVYHCLMIICKYFLDDLIIISKKIGNQLVSFFNDYVLFLTANYLAYLILSDDWKPHSCRAGRFASFNSPKALVGHSYSSAISFLVGLLGPALTQRQMLCPDPPSARKLTQSSVPVTQFLTKLVAQLTDPIGNIIELVFPCTFQDVVSSADLKWWISAQSH
jgi:hypothetical protein